MTSTTKEPDRRVMVNGVEIAVDDRSPGDDGSNGLPLVLVHGFTGGRVDFADVIDELATDRRVVAWDHRGHADSTNTGDPATYTLDQLAGIDPEPGDAVIFHTGWSAHWEDPDTYLAGEPGPG